MLKHMLFLSLLAIVGAASAEERFVITLYEHGNAVVRETREMTFEKGAHEVVFGNIPNGLMQGSVLLHDPQIAILRQEAPRRQTGIYGLYSQFIGKTVEVETPGGTLLRGELLDTAFDHMGAAFILKLADGSCELVPSESSIRIHLPELPKGWADRQGLYWLVDSKVSGAHEVDVSYECSGLSWQNGYNISLRKGESRGSFEAWTTVRNQTEVDFDPVELHLIRDSNVQRRDRYNPKASVKYSYADFEQQLDYDIPQVTSLPAGEEVRAVMIDPAEIKCEKRLVYNFYRDRNRVHAFLEVENLERGGMGFDLPAGELTIYEQQTDGREEILTKQQIGPLTPEQKLTLALGAVPGLRVEHTSSTLGMYEPQTHKWENRIIFTSELDEPVDVVIELYSEKPGALMGCTHPYRRIDLYGLEIDVRVPAKGTAKVEYSALHYDGALPDSLAKMQ